MIIFVFQIRSKSDRRILHQSFLDDLLKIRERTTTDKKDILCIDCSERNHRILTVGSHRHFHFAAF